jgi:hypothetical protein
MAQAVDHLPRKHEALSSNPTTAKKKNPNLCLIDILILSVRPGFVPLCSLIQNLLISSSSQQNIQEFEIVSWAQKKV